MTIPGFTAETAFYRRNQHYRSARQAIYSLAQMNRPIHPMLDRPEVPPVIEVPGEEIPVHSCPPGWSDIGGSCWPDSLTEPGGSGGRDSGGSDEVGGSGGPGGGVGGGGKPIPEKSDRPTRVDRMGKAWGKECEKKPTFKEFWDCCTKKSDECILENKKKNGPPILDIECVDAATVCQESPGRPST